MIGSYDNRHEMNRHFPQDIDARQLARAYVALVFARDLARGYLDGRLTNADLHPLLTMLDITQELLEEVMGRVLPEESPHVSLPVVSSDLLM